MPDHVLTARIYFNDVGNAENAFNHIKALAEHSAAHDRVVGTQPDTSWARLHECFAEEDGGDTSRCETTHRFVLNEQEEGGEAILWAPGQNVEPGDLSEYPEGGTVYSCIQGHTTQEGWEPPSTPSLWEPQ